MLQLYELQNDFTFQEADAVTVRCSGGSVLQCVAILRAARLSHSSRGGCCGGGGSGGDNCSSGGSALQCVAVRCSVLQCVAVR